jgi:hypothetical protein
VAVVTGAFQVQIGKRPFLRWSCLETIEKGRAMKDMIAQFIPQMTHEEKLDLLASLEKAIAEEMVPEAGGEADACPPAR